MASSGDIITFIKKTVRAYSPDAEIILFGSRARGTNRADSDWDILVLLNKAKISEQDKDMDYELWTNGLELGAEINTVLRTNAQWEENISLFKHNVLTEGIRL